MTKWTKKLPKAEGYYWFYTVLFKEALIIRIVRNGLDDDLYCALPYKTMRLSEMSEAACPRYHFGPKIVQPSVRKFRKKYELLYTE